METVLVTGASGLLGHKLTNMLLEKGYRVVGLYYSHEIPLNSNNLIKVRVNLRDRVRLEDLILKTKPDVIVHAAAYTDVDGCEVNRLDAWTINVEATRSIVRAARITKSYLLYISTDYVFDGEKGSYREDDVPAPVNYYGLTKLVAEELVRASDLLYTIVRPSAIYGVGVGKKNFAVFVAETLAKGGRVKALVDQYVSPTLNTLLAMSLLEIIELRPMGTLHVAGERMSRYDFAVKIARILNLPVENIEKARLSEFKWKAKRPRDSSLDTSKARRLIRTRFYDNELALKMFAREWSEWRAR